MSYKICPSCGSDDVIKSNNPLVPPICYECAEDKIDSHNLEHADFFCRTYNYPFNPDKWIKAIKTNPDNVIKTYVEKYAEKQDDPKYTTSTRDIWKMANKEWEKTITHSDLIENLEAVKEDFMKKGKIKWGTEYTFEELMQLENLFSTTVASFDVNNPMQIDSIKKACKLSIMVDKAVASSDIKSIRELSDSYNKFIKTAKIDEMIESSQGDVIRTVADLVEFLEKEGFKFDYYDNVDRDIVDKTIRDIKEHLKTLVLESTGLEQTLQTIKDAYKTEKHDEANDKATKELPLEELTKIAKDYQNDEIDQELQEEDIGDIDE